MMAIALLVLMLVQDPSDQIRRLVEKIERGDIEQRDEAAAVLIKLGPAALAEVRRHLKDARGETLEALTKVVARIEIGVRIAALSAPGPIVTLAAKDRPAAEVLAEFRKQTGIRSEEMDLPPDCRVTVNLKEATLWKAVDELCRSHGGLMYAFDVDRVVVRPEPYRKLPAFDLGPYRFLFDAFDVDDLKPRRLLDVTGAVLAPPGRFPDSAWIRVKRIEDHTGAPIPMYEGHGLAGNGPRNQREARPPVLFRAVMWCPGEDLPEECDQLKAFSGEVRLQFVVDRARRLSLKNPLEPGDRTETRDSYSIRLRDVCRDGPKVRIRATFQRPMTAEEKESGRTNGRFTVAMYTAQGERLRVIPGFPSVAMYRDREIVEWMDVLTFDLTGGLVPVSLDLEETLESHTLTIPFALDGVFLK